MKTIKELANTGSKAAALLNKGCGTLAVTRNHPGWHHDEEQRLAFAAAVRDAAVLADLEMKSDSSPTPRTDTILARFSWFENKWIDRELQFVPRLGDRVLVTDSSQKWEGDDWMVEGEVMLVEWSFRGGVFGSMVSITLNPRINQTGPNHF
jgi:hypothetical protein